MRALKEGSIGNLGGFEGLYAMGFMHDATGSFTGAVVFLVACMLTETLL